MAKEKRPLRPRQHQGRQPGRQRPMDPPCQADGERYVGAGLMRGRVVLITGGDSGIGRAAAVALAKEGADIAFAYLDERDDARTTTALIAKAGSRCLALRGDVTGSAFQRRLVDGTLREFGRIDVLINNAAVHFPAKRPEELQWRLIQRTFQVNVLAPIQLTLLVVPHLRPGAAIINTASVVAFRGSAHLLDYAATKGALVAWTRSLALALAERRIRVNAVAPGPIWTPLIPASFPPDEVATFGSSTPLGRAGQPDEVAPAFVLLASERGSYITGQCIHVNGGEIVNA
jgi:NAD(P)-dependent dehydrogenase (short-subunit alcohol dehydrogenase family)